LKFTAAPFTKFEPFTVSVKACEPAITLDGSKDEIMGGSPYTVNVMDVESPPPGVGLATKTLTTPRLATSPACMAAVSWVALTKFVARGCPPK
jgi:hypothetical protein